MEYQKRINLLDKKQNEPSNFKTRNWVEMNDESRGTCNKINQIKFKTSIIRSNLCDYSDAYILVSGTITIDGSGDNIAAKRSEEIKKGLIFENCVSFGGCISNINNIQIDNGKDIDVMMPMHNLIEYSDDQSKTSGNLW